jgi:hypothetical protein
MSVVHGLRVDDRELLLTTVVSAKADLREPSAEPSLWPLISSGRGHRDVHLLDLQPLGRRGRHRAGRRCAGGVVLAQKPRARAGAGDLMTPRPSFVENVSTLPTHAFGHRSLTWWGIIAFMVIEGSFFALAIAAYFFLMAQEQNWAPGPWQPPGIVAGTLFTLVMLLSEIPNTIIKKAAENYDVATVRKLLPLMVAIGLLLIVLRAFEFNSLTCFGTTAPMVRSSGRCCSCTPRTSSPTGATASYCGR